MSIERRLVGMLSGLVELYVDRRIIWEYGGDERLVHITHFLTRVDHGRKRRVSDSDESSDGDEVPDLFKKQRM
jgi:hypothetical protein